MKKECYIYLTTNLINNKKYIGQHRGNLTDDYFGSGTTIIKALQKYGKQNFTKEILEICTEETIDAREKYWIEYYDAVNDPNYYNNAEGGAGGDGWRAWRRWCKQHPEEAQKLYQNGGKRLQQWTKEHPKENQQNINKMLEAAHTKLKNDEEYKTICVERLNKGKEKWQQEHPEEHQAQVDKWRISGSMANSKPVRCITTNEVFPSISEAARAYGTYQANISKALNGKRNSAGKHPLTNERLKWEWVDDNQVFNT